MTKKETRLQLQSSYLKNLSSFQDGIWYSAIEKWYPFWCVNSKHSKNWTFRADYNLIMTRPFEFPFISSWSSIPHRPSSLNSSQLGLTDCYSIPSKQWNPSISIWLCLHNASFKRSDESWDLGWFTKVL